MSERLVITQGDDGPIVESLWRGVPHNRNECLGCGQDSIMRTAIHKLVYSFVECDCDEVGYRHLVERLWHPGCYVRSLALSVGQFPTLVIGGTSQAPDFWPESLHLRLDGPVVISQTPTDPGDIGEPRISSAEGTTYVAVPKFTLWPRRDALGRFARSLP